MRPFRLAPLGAIAVLAAFQSGPKPEDAVAAVVKAYLGFNASTDWPGLDKLPGVKWAPLPPKSLDHCLPDGGCFARQGAATLGGRTMTAIATGARTIVSNLYLRSAAPIGEDAVLAAIKPAGLTLALVRCPVQGGAGTTNWYKVTGAKLAPGFLSIQETKGAKPSEGFTVTRGEDLPPLQPNQLAMYSETCGAGADRKAVAAAGKPHELLAGTVVTLLAPAAGLYDWAALKAAGGDVAWNAGPVKGSPAPGDPNPLWLSGNTAFAGRKFSVNATGGADQVRIVILEEQGLHPRGEHMLGVVYEKGITVRLARCGPVYTESTNNWYSLVSARTKPAMIRQSIRYDGNQVQDTYELRLDGTLPARDPRDRDPGINDCR